VPAIDDYLAGLEARDAEIIGAAYAQARATVPDVEQGVSYGMPALIHRGRPLLSVMRAKTHVGLYPYSSSVVTAVVDALGDVDGMTSAKGTLRLPLGVAIPEQVVSRLVLARADEIHAAKAPKRRGTTPAE
jgi:uncharacterized protein YdhG (YjbR/CyaY superfamily)